MVQGWTMTVPLSSITASDLSSATTQTGTGLTGRFRCLSPRTALALSYAPSTRTIPARLSTFSQPLPRTQTAEGQLCRRSLAMKRCRSSWTSYWRSGKRRQQRSRNTWKAESCDGNRQAPMYELSQPVTCQRSHYAQVRTCADTDWRHRHSWLSAMASDTASNAVLMPPPALTP